GRTPLILSSIHGYSQLTDIFLNNGANIDVTDNDYNRTALHFAALNGHLSIVKELVKKGIDVNIKDIDGKTPLYYACRYGHEKVAKTLKSLGAKEKINIINFGYSSWMKKKLKEGQAVAWALGRIGYAVKTKNHFLIFSYYVYGNEPDEPRLANGHIHIDEIKGQKTIVFAGGSAYWHHNPERYNRWQKIHPDISFIYSFKDKKGRGMESYYFKDVDGPTYTYLPDGEKMQDRELKVESIKVESIRDLETGFLVEVDGLVIFHGGYHILFSESREKSFKKTINYLKETGKNIDLLIMPGHSTYDKVWPVNLKGVDYAAKTLKPKAFLVMAADSTEFVLKEVYLTLKKYSNHTKIFCPEHRGDSFHYGID
ncbi:MAG: ankyrin repeat domain-containing protein, partial [Candidatus Aminicenantes bacterium]